MWPSPNARASSVAAVDLDADLRLQIEANADLARLIHDLGFDLDFADRVRSLVAGLKLAVHAEVDDVQALQAAVTAARSQAKAPEMRFSTADRELFDAIAAAGANRAATPATTSSTATSSAPAAWRSWPRTATAST